MQADTWSQNDFHRTTAWYSPSPEAQPDDASSELPADDDFTPAVKAVCPQLLPVLSFFSENQALHWRYCADYQPPVRPAVTPPPPQA